MGPLAALEVSLGPAPADDAPAELRERDAAEREAFLTRHETVWTAADDGYVDRVIAPAQARRALSVALERLCT